MDWNILSWKMVIIEIIEIIETNILSLAFYTIEEKKTSKYFHTKKMCGFFVRSRKK